MNEPRYRPTCAEWERTQTALAVAVSRVATAGLERDDAFAVASKRTAERDAALARAEAAEADCAVLREACRSISVRLGVSNRDTPPRLSEACNIALTAVLSNTPGAPLLGALRLAREALARAKRMIEAQRDLPAAAGLHGPDWLYTPRQLEADIAAIDALRMGEAG